MSLTTRTTTAEGTPPPVPAEPAEGIHAPAAASVASADRKSVV